MLHNYLAHMVQSTETIRRYPSGLSVKARMTSSPRLASSPDASLPTEAAHDAQADMQVPSQTDPSGVSAQLMASQQPAGNQQQPAGNRQQPEGIQQHSLQSQQRLETDTSQQGSSASQAPAKSCDAGLASDTQHGMHHQSAPSSPGQHTECLTDAQQSAAVLAKWGMAIPLQLQQQLQEEHLQQQQLERVQPKQQLQQQQVHHTEEQVQLRQLQQLAEPTGLDTESSNVEPGHRGGANPSHKVAEEVSRGGVELTLEQPDGESRPPVVAPEVVRGRVVRATELWHKQLTQQEAQQQVHVNCRFPFLAFIGLHSQGSIQVLSSSGTRVWLTSLASISKHILQSQPLSFTAISSCMLHNMQHSWPHCNTCNIPSWALHFPAHYHNAHVHCIHRHASASSSTNQRTQWITQNPTVTILQLDLST